MDAEDNQNAAGYPGTLYVSCETYTGKIEQTISSTVQNYKQV